MVMSSSSSSSSSASTSSTSSVKAYAPLGRVSFAIGAARSAPRFTSPLSFLSRVAYSLAALSTSYGLLFLFLASSSASASSASSARASATSGGGGGGALGSGGPGGLLFTQVVDHFDSLNPATFHQRYWENQRWWKVPAEGQGFPLAFLRINSFHLDKDWNASTIAYWAEELGAVIYELEPRYAGKSYPTSDVATGDLRYYSIEQSVADVVAFISNKTALLPNNTRWVVMGELFDGAFATWTRAKPRLAFGVVAVSPHLLATEAYTAYDRAYQAAIGTKCSAAVHNILQTVSYQLQLSPEDNRAYQRNCSGWDMELPDPEFMYVISTILFSNMDSNSATLCKTFMDVQYANNATKLDTLARYVLNYNTELGMNFTEWDFALDTGSNMSDAGAGFRPTYYLKCTQLGQFETADPSSPNSLIPAERSLDWYLATCQRLFNNKTAARPNTIAVNTNYGGRAPEGCNMAFVVSPNDPYAELGPDPSAIAAEQKTTGNQIITINCATPQVSLSLFDLPLGSDPTCLIQARAQVFETLKTWKTQPDSCPQNNGGGGSGGGGGGHDDGDMALVGVFATIGGIIVGVLVAGAVFVFLARGVVQKWKQSIYAKIN